ncbi:MAG: P-loop NTPase [Deltaproteobacteria bacterium]|nr:P-loop NTPase [Deltaproteobacteria bacterium]
MAQIYAIGGGKGGSGKSFLAANFGALFARQGHNTVLIDLDLGGSNLHSLLGIRQVKKGLNSYLNRSVNDLSASAIPTEIPNLHLISSQDCSLEIGNLFYAQKMKIINAIRKLPFDKVFIDLGAGSTYNVLDFFLSAHEGIFVFTPEPTSIQNTVQFIKAVYLRKVKQILKQYAFQNVTKELAEESEAGLIRSPLDVVDRVMTKDQDRGKLLEKALGKLVFKLVLNQYRKHIDETLGSKIEKVCNRHFYASFQFVGNITHDERVHNSVLAKSIFANKYPYTPTSTDLKQASEVMLKKGEETINNMGKYGEV